MGGLFGGKPDNSAQIAMQQKQLDMQEAQQKKLDAQTRDQSAALLARQRAGASGGMRMLMSPESLGPQTGGQSTLGSST